MQSFYVNKGKYVISLEFEEKKLWDAEIGNL